MANPNPNPNPNQEPLSRTEWLAVGICFLGTMMLSCTLEPTDWATVQLSWMLSKMVASMALMLVALPALELVSRKAKQAQATSLVELCTALQAGLCVGVGNAGIAGGLQALSHGATSTQVPLSIEHPSSSPSSSPDTN